MKSIDRKDISPNLWGVSSRLYPKYDQEYNEAIREAFEGMDIANPGALLRSPDEMQHMADVAKYISHQAYAATGGADYPLNLDQQLNDGTAETEGSIRSTIRVWIAEEVAKQVEEGIKNAIAHLVSELNDAAQTIEDLECQVEVGKNSWDIPNSSIKPKYYSTSYRGDT